METSPAARTGVVGLEPMLTIDELAEYLRFRCALFTTGG
jgi:hypothetical protein